MDVGRGGPPHKTSEADASQSSRLFRLCTHLGYIGGRSPALRHPGDHMKTYVSVSTRLLAVILAAVLFHIQLAFAAGCDLPMFGGRACSLPPPVPRCW